MLLEASFIHSFCKALGFISRYLCKNDFILSQTYKIIFWLLTYKVTCHRKRRKLNWFYGYKFMFYKFEIFSSFPLTATFGKKGYKMNECGTKQPCLFALFYLFFSIRTKWTSIYEFWNCIYTKQLLFGEMITKPKYFFF